jgi:serine phosphatase RsbU (regulator of sigma subunit)
VLVERGDVLFAYTDGLVEARREGEVYGIDRLARLVSQRAAGLPAELLVRTVHDEVKLWADTAGDDTAALALRRLP